MGGTDKGAVFCLMVLPLYSLNFLCDSWLYLYGHCRKRSNYLKLAGMCLITKYGTLAVELMVM
jgi:hypothetical protein